MSEITIAIEGLVALRESINQVSVDITKLVGDIETETTQHTPVPPACNQPLSKPESQPERVTPAETFADGELVVGDVNSHLYKVDGGKICRVVKGGAVLGVADHFSKLTIGSQFVTTCDKSISPSGKGDFLVTEDLNGKSGEKDKLFLVGAGNNNSGKVEIDDDGESVHCKGNMRVIPCDLAYYTRTVSPGVSIIAYEIEGGCRTCKYSTKTVTDIETAWMWDKPNNWSLSDAILNDINPPVVPLSVSAITGMIAPKVEV